MRHVPAWSLILATVLCLAAAPAARAADASFEALGRFWVAGVSDDGNTVAGTGNDPAAPGQVMVLWTPAGGLRTAGWSAGHEHTSATAISGNGSTILGVDYNANMLTWTAAGGIQYPPGTNNYPGGINRDGSVLVGGHVAGGPFRWTAAGGAAPLPTPPGWADNGADGHGNAVSADGSVVAGTLFNAPGHRRAFVWTEAGGTSLLDLPAGVVGSDATAISADGSTIVGWTYDATDAQRPFRRTAGGGMELLGGLGAAVDVTGDGSVVIGNSGEFSGAFIWDARHGARDLKAVLANDYGLDVADWTTLSAGGITPDGRVIVGTGSHPQLGQTVAWRAVLPEPTAAAPLMVLACLALRRRDRGGRRLAVV